MHSSVPAMEPTTSTRWMGVGRSDARETYAAAVAATRAALRCDEPTLVMAFFADNHDPAELARGVGDVARGVPLIGCSTNGEIAPGGPSDGTVVICAIGGSGFTVATTASVEVNGRQREAGEELARCVSAVGERQYQVMIVLTDGLAHGQETLLRGIYGVVGAGVPLFGGAAADSCRLSRTFQIHGTDVLTNGAVAACIGSDAPVGIGISHGWRKAGDAMTVTSSRNGRVFELDDQPALDMYLRRLGAPASIYHDRAALHRYVLSRPLGVQRRGGIEVRNMSTEVDVEGRSIGGCGELTQGELAWAMEGDEAGVLAAADAACEAAVGALDGRPPIGMLTFSCAACRGVLGADGVVREVARLEGQARGIPFAGFYTYGEIARTRGIDGFHSQTTVVLALA